jgi:hypothetical protein
VAQTKKKRTRKKRGTQAGNVDNSRRSRPRNRAEAKSQARSGGNRNRSVQKGDNPPTWKGATLRGLIASGVFVVLLMVLFGRPLVSSLIIGLVMMVFYIPAGY